MTTARSRIGVPCASDPRIPGAAAPDLDALLPHSGRSRLIRAVLEASDDRIVCEGVPPSDPEHPLRLDGRLWPAAAIEYGAQAMAAHGALADRGGGPPRIGYLVAVRDVHFVVDALDAITGPLRVAAERVFVLGDQVSYAFEVGTADGTPLVRGRANVSLRGAAMLAAAGDSALGDPPRGDA
jgi:predicted hotdog family 3-hydroxylacyl-ACP dehydratase